MPNSVPYIVVRDIMNGFPRMIIQDYTRLEFTRIENNFGTVYIDLPFTYSFSDFKTDDRIEIWRYKKDGNPYLFAETVYFLRLVRMKSDEQGKKFVHLIGYDAIEILNRRIVAYPESADSADLTTSKVIKSGCADDMIKQIIRENYSTASTDTSRNISSDFFSVQDNTGLGYSLKKRFEYRKILPLIQEIAEDSTLNGSYISFDIFPISNTSLEFRTYAGQRGNDRTKTSGDPLILSLDRGNMSYASITNDATEEFNFIYCGSRGGDVLVTQQDEARVTISPYNRREDWEDYSSDTGSTTAQTEANYRLLKSKAKLTVNSHVVSIPGSDFGSDINFGDYVTVNYDGISLNARINKVRILVHKGIESVSLFGRDLEDDQY